MKNGIHRRLHPRVPLTLPVDLLTPQGVIKGTTVNVSVNGFALILFKEKPDIGDEFDITLKSSEDHEITVTCEKLWWGDIVPHKTVFNGVGVRFTKISPGDSKIITSMVEQYYRVSNSKSTS